MISENMKSEVLIPQDAEAQELKRLKNWSNANLAGELKRAIRTKGKTNCLTACVGFGCLVILGQHMNKSFLALGNDPYRLKYSGTRPKVGRQRKKATSMSQQRMAVSPTQLDEKSLKCADDAVHKIQHLLERCKNRLTLKNLRLSERYVNAELKILVSGALISCGGDVCDFIACYQRAGSLGERKISAIANSNPTVYECGDGEHEPVLVHDIEIVNVQECVVKSDERLYSTKSFLRSQGHALYFSLSRGRCILLGNSADWEVGAAIWSPAASLNELPRKMIQRTSKIVDCVSGNEREIVWDGIDSNDKESCVLDFGYSVRLSADSIGFRFPEILNPTVQVFDVLFGPFDF